MGSLWWGVTHSDWEEVFIFPFLTINWVAETVSIGWLWFGIVIGWGDMPE